jgi:hypothetical protein
MKFWFYILAMLSLTACLHNNSKTGLEGKPVPQFSLLLPDSVSYFNTKNLPKDKPVVMLSFIPQCPYCRAQVREITEDINDLSEIQFLIFTTPPFSGMKKFYEEFQLGKYKNIITGVDTNDFFGNYFQAAQVPYLAIYGKDKKLNQSFIGKMYISQIKKIALR